MKKPYEVFEHTADMGLRIHGLDLEDLFRNAALGFYDLVTDVKKITKKKGVEEKSVVIHLESDSLENLFLKWLRELLFIFATKHLVFVKFEFKRLKKNELLTTATGLPFDPGRDVQKHEVKAITYHQSRLDKTKAGWLAEVIVDV